MNWPWGKSQFEKDATALLTAMKASLIDLANWQKQFNQQQQQLITEVNKIMPGIEEIKTDLTAEGTKLDALIAAFEALKNNTNPGPGPGQVIVNQADLDAIDATIQGDTAKIPA